MEYSTVRSGQMMRAIYAALHSVPYVALLVILFCAILVAVPIRAHAGTLSKPSNNLGLVGYWSFDDGTGAVATDFSGNGNDAVLSGNPGWVSGRRGNAVVLDGSTQSGTVGDVEELRITGDQTISMWLKPTNFSARRNPYAKAYGGEGTITQETNGRLNYYYGTNGGNSTPYQAFSTNSSITLDTWTHVTLVRDLTNMTLRWYINGELDNTVGAAYAAAAAGSNPAYIGAGYVSRYAGSLDEVRVYNRALGASEIAAIVRAGATRLGASSVELQRGTSLENGLVGHWTFDGADTQSVISDRSGGGNHGYFYGGATSSGKTIGRLGQAFSFNGTSNYFIPSGAPSIGATESFTYAFWIKVRSYTNGGSNDGNGSFFLDRSPAVTPLLSLKAVADKFTFQKRYDSGSGLGGVASNSSITQDVWTHIVMVRDIANLALRIYVNGVEENSAIDTGAALTPPVPKFGGHATACPPTCFNGLFDDIRIYNRALSASEIKQLYNLGQASIHQ